MKISLISDIHTEFHRDHGRSFVDSLNADVDVIVIAGDLCLFLDLDKTLKWFAERFQQVIYVWGNHECWRTEIQKVREEAHYCAGPISNLHILDNTAVTIGGQRFIGGTLWFRDDPHNAIYQHLMNDFARIHRLAETVYDENLRTIDFLEQEATRGDIVVSHHLPLMQSVPIQLKFEEINRFFVCKMDDFIARIRPKMWFHGHTHHSCDYLAGDTRVLCNPFGYATVDINLDCADEGLFIEV